MAARQATERYWQMRYEMTMEMVSVGIEKKTVGMTPRQILGIILVVGVFVAISVVLVGWFAGQGRTKPSGLVETPTQQLQLAVRVIPTESQIVREGLAVAYAVRPAATQPDLTEIRFTVTDAATGQPAILEAPPAVWIDPQLVSANISGAPSCEAKVKQYVQGTLDVRAQIDLNSYFILALNQDASISVIDPLNGVSGISQLYAMVSLASPGEDWVLTRDGRRLFVSMPAVGQVAVVDTETFTVLQNIDVGLNPVRVAMQPDGRYVWVGNDSTDTTTGGVTVIDTQQLRVVAQIPTGVGRHAIAFSGISEDAHAHENASDLFAPIGYAFVTNSSAGTVSVIDTDRLQKHADITLGIHPTSLDVASANHAVYLASATEPEVVVIDATNQQISGRLDIGLGIGVIRIAPGGRWGFVISPTQNRVDVLDTTTNQIVHTVTVDGTPDRVSFSEAFAYVHAAQKPDIALFDLAQLGKPNQLAPIKIIGGQASPSQALASLAVADSIVPIHEHGSHMLITNPADQSIYEYMEGMSAPMSSYQNYNRTPRAVRVIDRTIRAIGPGAYVATMKIPRSGAYQVAFLIHSPRIVDCFGFKTEPDAASITDGSSGLPKITILSTERDAKVGTPFVLRLAVVDAQNGAPIVGVDDLTIIATLATGQRTERFRAEPLGGGMYAATLNLPVVGNYMVYFSVPSRRVDTSMVPAFTLRVAQ